MPRLAAQAGSVTPKAAPGADVERTFITQGSSRDSSPGHSNASDSSRLQKALDRVEKVMKAVQGSGASDAGDTPRRKE